MFAFSVCCTPRKSGFVEWDTQSLITQAFEAISVNCVHNVKKAQKREQKRTTPRRMYGGVNFFYRDCFYCLSLIWATNAGPCFISRGEERSSTNNGNITVIRCGKNLCR